MDSSEYLSLTEAAKRLGISHWTLYRRIDDGVLQAFEPPVNRRVKFVRRRDIDALLSLDSATPVAAQGPRHEEGR